MESISPTYIAQSYQFAKFAPASRTVKYSSVTTVLLYKHEGSSFVAHLLWNSNLRFSWRRLQSSINFV